MFWLKALALWIVLGFLLSLWFGPILKRSREEGSRPIYPDDDEGA